MWWSRRFPVPEHREAANALQHEHDREQIEQSRLALRPRGEHQRDIYLSAIVMRQYGGRM